MNDVQKMDSEMSNRFDVNEFLKPYVKKWFWFILSILFFLILAIYYLKKSVNIYDVKTTVLIKDSKKAPSSEMGALATLGGFGSGNANSIENEMEILKSKKLIQDVVDQLGLQFMLYNNKGLKKELLYGSSSPVVLQLINEKQDYEAITDPIILTIKGDKIEISSKGLPKSINTTYNRTVSLPFANFMILKNPNFKPNKKNPLGDLEISFSKRNEAIDYFQKMINVLLVNKDATVVELSIKYPNIELAKTILNKEVETYNNDAINDKNSESKKTKDFIDDRVRIIAEELGEVENEKERFKVANKITDLASEAAFNFTNSETTRSQLLDAETQKVIANDLISYIRTLGNGEVMPATVGLSNPLAAANINSYNQLVLERNKLLENATPKNPLVIDINKQLAALKVSVLDALQKYKLTLNERSGLLQNLHSDYSTKITKIPAQEKFFRSIERQQQIKESLYLLLLQKREEAAISMAITSPKARVIDEAYSSIGPVAPKKMFILAIALLVGVVVPFLLIYIKELFNNKIRSKHDLELATSTSILGEIPRSNTEDGMIKQNDLSPMAEAFRILITNVNFLLPKKSTGKIVYVTSTVKGEGKTFVSVNLALSVAKAKSKSIIIGADIRNPQLQRYNPSRKGLAGLTEFLFDENTQLSEITHESSFNPHLDVIYSGSIPPNPTELLSNNRFGELLDLLKDSYEYIIVDTAPLMLVTDTLLVSDYADATVYVSRSRYTEKRLIEFANKLIDAKRIKNVGFVINDVQSEDFGYGNKYGYGYAATEETFMDKIKKIFR